MKRGGKIASSKNLLLVSGDGALKRHITDALGLAGIPRTTLATATCGRDALRIVAKDRPRLLIVDNDLSDTTGLELLHALYQDGIKPLVVYMATQHTFELEKVVRQLGVLYYTEKPPDLAAITHIVAAVYSPQKSVFLKETQCSL